MRSVESRPKHELLPACRQVLGIEGDPATPSEDAGGADRGQDDGAPAGDASADVRGGGDASNDAAACADACPVDVVADDLGQPTVLTVDANNVYFADESKDEVYQCPKTGCGKTPLLLGPGAATGIAVDATRVYWSDFFGNKVVGCTIGGCANAPTSLAGSQISAGRLTGDGTNLYWNAEDQKIVTCVPGNCGSPKTLATGQADVAALAAEAAVVYWTNDAPGGGSVYACAAAGCASATKVGAGSGSVAVKNGVKFWVSGNAIVSCAAATCVTPTTLGASTQPWGLATDGTYVYWRDVLERKVLRCHTGGCTGGAEVVASNQPGHVHTNVALDGQYVYWANGAQVVRRRK